MLGPATPFPHPDPAHGVGGPTPRQELIAAHYLAQGETVGMAARLAGIRAPTLQRLVEEPEFEALVEECRRIEALPRAEQEARLDRFFRRAVERALADGRVGAIAAAMRLLGLGARGGRGPGGGDRQADDEVSEEELAEAGGRWGMVPDGEGGWLTPDGREAMPGREVDIVIGKGGPVRCLETLELAELSPDFVDSLDDQTPGADAGAQPARLLLWRPAMGPGHPDLLVLGECQGRGQAPARAGTGTSCIRTLGPGGRGHPPGRRGCRNRPHPTGPAA